MTVQRRGVGNLRTMAGLVDKRRARTSHGALLELSMLEMERQRLTKEAQRAEQRCAEIGKRIAEIDAKAQRLHRFARDPAAREPKTPAAAFPVHSLSAGNVKRRRLSY